MLGTQPYPTQTPNPPYPAPYHVTQLQPPTPTLTYPQSTQSLPYSWPAIQRLALPYHTLSYPSAVYVGPFRCFGNSVIHSGIWVRFDPFVPFRFVSVR